MTSAIQGRFFRPAGLAERGFDEMRIHVFAALGDFAVRKVFL
jgi:hypothetical protein